MPRHRQVTTCRNGGPVSKMCSCEHCALAVCDVCGAYEGGLTTDCPGERLDFDQQEEVYKTNLDYTDTGKWHQGEPMERRTPRFASHDATAAKPCTCAATCRQVEDAERRVPCPQHGTTRWQRELDALRDQRDRKLRCASTAHAGHAPRLVTREKVARIIGCTCGWQTSQGVSDSDDAFVQHVGTISAERADRIANLQQELTRRAIAWVVADRIADDHSATLSRVEAEIDAYLRPRQGQEPDERALELLGKLEGAKAGFHLADQRAVRCDEEFRQAARTLVTFLEGDSAASKDPAE